MKSWELLQFEDDAALAKSAAKYWLDELTARAPTQACCVALSGGRIARRFFSEVASQVGENWSILEHVEFFWADERCVPPTDPESNFKLAQEYLLVPLSIRPERVHRIRGEADPATAVTGIETVIRRTAPAGEEGQPVLGFVFLGMGEDGHIASLFPAEAEETMRSRAVYRQVIGPKPPPVRITLGYAPLRAARNVWVLASGPGKEDALRRSLASSPTTPLGTLLQLRQNTRIFTDIR